MSKESTREAWFWHRLDGDVQCTLCHQLCRVRPGKRGLCGVRENQDGKFMTLVYGNLIAASVDPIEKKPFFHFLPGSLAYSIATAGCNFRCLHCQNADISQLPKETGKTPGRFVPPEEVVAAAEAEGCQTIAYTYTEPTIFFEYAYDVAVLARERGLKNVFVSNGYTGEEAARKIAPVLDANNIDLKGDDQFYRKICGARLEPVKKNIEFFWKSGVWMEVTTLLIPGYNDSVEQLRAMAEFLASVSTEIPWHVTAFYPMYKLKGVPATGAESLRKGVKIGRDAGLKYVYSGNIPEEDENTRCHICGELLVERMGFRIMRNSVVEGRCPKCGTAVSGRWS
ncbi:MAG: Cyclic pyranopterin monophosphate synthase [Methanosaeta sp. PtaU1.Bin060]|nr:MAG: Cyclic pyranopterin monophosphate synthase [Methanosaeta sp. PtaU1.Bin060]